MHHFNIPAYPKRIPPKATKRPMRIAGTAEPATPSGGLSTSGMMIGGPVLCLNRSREWVALRLTELDSLRML
jgi:hypothetical protein